MTQEPPPPIVTISDPNNPGVVGDVIGGGSEKEPWKPSRTAVRRALLALVVLVAVAVPVAVVQVRDHDHELDARAAAQVRLGPLENDVANVTRTGVVPFSLFNNGPDDITVLSARIDREGYPTKRLNVRIPEGTSGTLDVALPDPCPTAVSPFSRPRLLLLTVRTHRGNVVRKSVNVGDSYGFSYQESLRATCGFLDAGEAIQATVVQTTRRPQGLDLEVSLLNTGRRGFDVRALDALDGLRADTSLPLHLDGVEPDEAHAVRVPVRLRVADCRQARLSTTVDLTSDYVAPGLTFVTDRGTAELYFDPEVQTALTALVQRSCP